MMRMISAMILLLPGAGCTSAVNETALCDGTRQARSNHAAALAESADDRATLTGARLIALIDAGCAS